MDCWKTPTATTTHYERVQLIQGVYRSRMISVGKEHDDGNHHPWGDKLIRLFSRFYTLFFPLTLIKTFNRSRFIYEGRAKGMFDKQCCIQIVGSTKCYFLLFWTSDSGGFSTLNKEVFLEIARLIFPNYLRTWKIQDSSSEQGGISQKYYL